MRKLIFTAALAIGSLSALTASTVSIHDGIMDEVITEEFKEIPVDQVPAAVVQALAVAHEGATITKAYVNEDEVYKLEVTGGDGSQGVLYADAEGNWLEMDE
ncbi:hypothetical protein [Allomuricauda sp. d1]|uniref:hypothetical protein n=1 Tax=Allomuricauda sp. d1 TaxID=3136725 RepID=UPI0031DAF212